MCIPQRVLIIRAGALGDTLLALPAVALLRRAWPGFTLCWLGNPGYLEWLKGTPFVDSCRSIDSSLFCHLFDGTPDERLIDFFRYFDFCISWTRDPERIVERLLRSVFGERCLSAAPFPEPGQGIHAADHLLRTLRSSAVPELRGFQGDAPEAAVLKGIRFADEPEPGYAHPRLRVMIHPGSGDRRKCWPLDRFQAVAENLRAATGAELCWLLGPADQHLESDLRNFCSAREMKLLCGVPLRELAVMLRRAIAFLGNDSGVSHLAAAVGTPAWVLFGPTAPEEWAPRGEHVRIFRFPASAGSGTATGIPDARTAGRQDPVSVEKLSRTMIEAIREATRGDHHGC